MKVFSNLRLDIRKTIGDYSEDERELIYNELLKLHSNYGLGICLNKIIHKLFHDLYGYTNNTIKQFKEFVIRLEHNEFLDYLKENKLKVDINYESLKELKVW